MLYIMLKVTRDKIVSTWKFVEDVEVGAMEYGSGYPSGTCAGSLIV